MAKRLYTAADVTRQLMETGALPGNPGDEDEWRRAFGRVRTWGQRGKLPEPVARRPNGAGLWNEEQVARLAAALTKGA